MFFARARRMLPLSPAGTAALRQELDWRLRFLVQEALSVARHRGGGGGARLAPCDLRAAAAVWLPRGDADDEPTPAAARRAHCSLSEVSLTVVPSLHDLPGACARHTRAHAPRSAAGPRLAGAGPRLDTCAA